MRSKQSDLAATHLTVKATKLVFFVLYTKPPFVVKCFIICESQTQAYRLHAAVTAVRYRFHFQISAAVLSSHSISTKLTSVVSSASLVTGYHFRHREAVIAHAQLQNQRRRDLASSDMSAASVTHQCISAQHGHRGVLYDYRMTAIDTSLHP